MTRGHAAEEETQKTGDEQRERDAGEHLGGLGRAVELRSVSVVIPRSPDSARSITASVIA